MQPAFPVSDYYGGSALSPHHQTTAVLPATDLAGQQVGRHGDSSHVHHTADRRGWCPAIPLQPRHGYAAGFPRGLLADEKQPATESPKSIIRACTAVRPISTRFEPARRLRGFHHWFTSGYTFPSRLPGMGHLAVLTHPVVVGAAPAHPYASRVRLPPASTACCDGRRVGPFLPLGCVAPRGAPSHRHRAPLPSQVDADTNPPRLSPCPPTRGRC